MSKKFAILASGRGSNAKALLEDAQTQAHQISFVLTDKPDAGVIKVAEKFSCPCYVEDFKKLPTSDFQEIKQKQEQQVAQHIETHQIDYILLAGYMRLLSRSFVERYYGKIINIHPSMLPLFPGKDGYKDAFESGVQDSGVTVHFVDNEVDSGPIIMQEKFPRYQQDTFQDFQARGLAVEHRIYPLVVRLLAEERICLKPNGEVEVKQ